MDGTLTDEERAAIEQMLDEVSGKACAASWVPATLRKLLARASGQTSGQDSRVQSRPVPENTPARDAQEPANQAVTVTAAEPVAWAVTIGPQHDLSVYEAFAAHQKDEAMSLAKECLFGQTDRPLPIAPLYFAHAMADEILRLREAIRRLAEQDATLSVCGGAVQVTMDGTLTDAERDAIEFAIRKSTRLRDGGKTGAALRGLLERLG